MPKRSVEPFQQLERKLHHEQRAITIKERARHDLMRMRAHERAKHPKGGLSFAGHLRHHGVKGHHVNAFGKHHPHAGSHRKRGHHPLTPAQRAHLNKLHHMHRHGLTAKQRAHLAYLHSHYHFGKKKA